MYGIFADFQECIEIYDCALKNMMEVSKSLKIGGCSEILEVKDYQIMSIYHL